MSNYIKKIIGWILFIWGFIFLIISISSILINLEFWENKPTSFYFTRIIYIFIFILIPLISGSILISNEKIKI